MIIILILFKQKQNLLSFFQEIQIIIYLYLLIKMHNYIVYIYFLFFLFFFLIKNLFQMRAKLRRKKIT